MGFKFYRVSDRPKKFMKRFEHTRSWFRDLKWVACKWIWLLTVPQTMHIRWWSQDIHSREVRLSPSATCCIQTSWDSTCSHQLTSFHLTLKKLLTLLQLPFPIARLSILSRRISEIDKFWCQTLDVESFLRTSRHALKTTKLRAIHKVPVLSTQMDSRDIHALPTEGHYYLNANFHNHP